MNKYFLAGEKKIWHVFIKKGVCLEWMGCVYVIWFSIQSLCIYIKSLKLPTKRLFFLAISEILIE